MIHDLDLLLATVGADVESVEAVGVNVLTPRVDIANARLRFASGCIANVTASRISREPYERRASSSTTPTFDRLRRAGGRGVSPGRRLTAAPAIEGGRLEVASEEPLRRELAEGFDAVGSGGQSPASTGRAGRDALALATRIAQMMGNI